jgi:hypothetical protein
MNTLRNFTVSELADSLEEGTEAVLLSVVDTMPSFECYWASLMDAVRKNSTGAASAYESMEDLIDSEDDEAYAEVAGSAMAYLNGKFGGLMAHEFGESAPMLIDAFCDHAKETAALYDASAEGPAN